MGPYCQRAKLYREKNAGVNVSCKSSCTEYLPFLLPVSMYFTEFCSHEAEGWEALRTQAGTCVQCVHVGHAQMAVRCRKVIECIQNLSSSTLDSFPCCNLAVLGLKLPQKLPHPWFPKTSRTS